MVAEAIEQRTPILEAHGISKRFGSVRALEGADFEVYPGEVVALIGDNGAGKSTLIKILSGALRPDTGTIMLRGRPAEFHSPRDARAAGIETVYQDLALAPDRDGALNLAWICIYRRMAVPAGLYREHREPAYLSVILL